MLRFGQAIKTKREIKYRIKSQNRKGWSKGYKIEDYKARSPFDRHERYFVIVIPKGTIGVISKVYIDYKTEWFGVRFRNPMSNKVTRWTIGLYSHDIDLDVDPVEKVLVYDLQKDLIIKQKDSNFDKVKRLKKIL